MAKRLIIEWNNPFNRRTQNGKKFSGYPLWAIFTMIPGLNIIMGILMLLGCYKRRRIVWKNA